MNETLSARGVAATLSLVALAVSCGSSGSAGAPAAPEGAGGAFAAGGNVGASSGGALSSGGVTDPGGTTSGGASSTSSGGASAGGASPSASGGSGVTFDWPETVPGEAKPCKAGHYVGTFICQYQPAGTPDGSTGGFPINGPIDFRLDESANGEFLEVSGGTLDGLALLAIHFKAEIAGKLECGTGAFTGDLVNGSYAIDPFPAGGTFNGPMSGFISTGAPCTGTCLGGKWALHETGAAGTNHIGTCAGTWTATLQP